MSKNIHRRRRSVAIIIIGLLLAGGIWWQAGFTSDTPPSAPPTDKTSQLIKPDNLNQPLATTELAKLPVKGRAPKADYSRDKFGNGWAKWKSCDTRQRILGRDLTDIEYNTDGCTVLSGVLNDPYTGKIINFTRGTATSSAVQIDHVVALSDAWQKGAQNLDAATREQLANDDLELIAVDGRSNQQKSNADAASWLPPNKNFRCKYVARQIAVKIKYSLWVTPAEHDAMAKVLTGCPEERLPSP